jgi:hypothetical protein
VGFFKPPRITNIEDNGNGTSTLHSSNGDKDVVPTDKATAQAADHDEYWANRTSSEG